MLNEILKRAKEDKLMTNQQLADAANLPVDTINKILAGTTKNPTLDTLRRLATALDISADKMLGMPELEEIVKEAAELPEEAAAPEAVYTRDDMAQLYDRFLGAYVTALENAQKEKRRWFTVTVILLVILGTVLVWDLIHPTFGYIKY